MAMNSDKSHSVNKAKTEYQKNQTRSWVFLIILIAVLIITTLIALKAGSYETSVVELVKGIFNLSSDAKINLVVRNNRLPRILTAIVAGMGLALSGCILQAILKNPLASASTLGVSQGASFGAAIAIVVFGLGNGMGLGVPLCAFIGSIAVAVTILALSRFRNISPEGIVLSGVAISAMFTGATTLIQYFADEVQLATLVYWTFGDLGSAGWSDVRNMAVVVAALSAYCYYHRWDYNALLAGSETAVSLGINVKRLTVTSMILSCLTCAVIVSNVGLINFIGLVAPHIVKTVIGNNHNYLIPASLLAGASILLLGDLFARVVISPVILPIGAITSFLGGPLFLYLLFKGGKKNA